MGEATATTIDLNAARAARREAKGAPTVQVSLGEETFVLPDEMPFAVLEAVGELEQAQKDNDGAKVAKSISTMARAFLGDQYDRFAALAPSADDVMAMFEQVSENAYGVTLGESPASPD